MTLYIPDENLDVMFIIHVPMIKIGDDFLSQIFS